MAEVSIIHITTDQLKILTDNEIPYTLIETWEETVQSTPDYVHNETEIKELKTQLSALYKKQFNLKHPNGSKR